MLKYYKNLVAWLDENRQFTAVIILAPNKNFYNSSVEKHKIIPVNFRKQFLYGIIFELF
jgi:hypothetical protein